MLNTREAAFFSERCTFEVMHSLDYLREHIISWPIMRDPRRKSYFFNTSCNHRCHCKAAAGGLFSDLLARQAAWLKAQLVSLRPLRTPKPDERFWELHARLQNSDNDPGDCCTGSLQFREQYGHLLPTVTYLSPDAAPRVPEILSGSACLMLCQPRPQATAPRPGKGL